jgi:hypothetical protein
MPILKLVVNPQDVPIHGWAVKRGATVASVTATAKTFTTASLIILVPEANSE